jgi:hypothetical protein
MKRLELLLCLALLLLNSCGGGGSSSDGRSSALCNDGTYSYSNNCSGTCSNHGGVKIWYNDCGRSIAAMEVEGFNYVDNMDGTVTDNITGLLWQQSESIKYYNWYQAVGEYHPTANPEGISICGDLSLAEYKDWRLPSLAELRTIKIPYYTSPALHPVFDGQADLYWTAIESEKFANVAWSIDFNSMEDYSDEHEYLKYNSFLVRCLR